MPYSEFARLLNVYLENQDRPASWLANRIGVSPAAVSRWRSGEQRPNTPEKVIEVADALSIRTREERDDFLRAAGYGVTNSAGEQEHQVIPSMERGQFLVWIEGIVSWSEADELDRSSWAGLLVYALRRLIQQITTHRILFIMSIVVLWGLSGWLLIPMLRWQLEEQSLRWVTCIKYGIASVSLPAFVATLTVPDGYQRFQQQTDRQKASLWLLKYLGALGWFNIFATVLVGFALVAVSLSLREYSQELAWLVVGLLLLLCHIGAKRYPIDSYRTFGCYGEIQPLEQSILVLFLVWGPLLAIVMLTTYSVWLHNAAVGPAVFIALFAIVLWEHRKQHPSILTDWAAIVIFGFLFPVIILTFGTFVDEPAWNVALTYPVPTTLIFTYFLSESWILATLVIRNRPTVIVRSMLAFVAIEGLILILLLTTQSISVLIGFIGLLAFVWFLWGQNRFRQYFSIHASFWVLQLLLFASVFLSLQDIVAVNINLITFVAIVSLLTAWAYRSSPSQISEAIVQASNHL